MNHNEPKNRIQIFLEGKKINETLTGTELIVESYSKRQKWSY
ncbi:MAG: hypothetical protein NY202_03300 [Mollicutes bacterium UO1]